LIFQFDQAIQQSFLKTTPTGERARIIAGPVIFSTACRLMAAWREADPRAGVPISAAFAVPLSGGASPICSGSMGEMGS
jgi:hypothetical protein